MLSESPETSDSSIKPINKIYKSVQSLGKSEAHYRIDCFEPQQHSTSDKPLRSDHNWENVTQR